MSVAQSEIAEQIKQIKAEWKETVEELNNMAAVVLPCVIPYTLPCCRCLFSHSPSLAPAFVHVSLTLPTKPHTGAVRNVSLRVQRGILHTHRCTLGCKPRLALRATDVCVSFPARVRFTRVYMHTTTHPRVLADEAFAATKSKIPVGGAGGAAEKAAVARNQTQIVQG